MPLYEYRCPACEGRFEVIQHLGANAAETVCPSCGGRHVERQLSTFAVASSGASAAGGCGEGGGGFGCGGPQCGGGGGGCGGGDWN